MSWSMRWRKGVIWIYLLFSEVGWWNNQLQFAPTASILGPFFPDRLLPYGHRLPRSGLVQVFVSGSNPWWASAPSTMILAETGKPILPQLHKSSAKSYQFRA